MPEGFNSSTLLGIKYPSSGEDVAVGNFIKPSDSADKPEVTFVAPDQNAHYTLLMVTRNFFSVLGIKPVLYLTHTS